MKHETNGLDVTSVCPLYSITSIKLLLVLGSKIPKKKLQSEDGRKENEKRRENIMKNSINHIIRS